MEYSHKLARSTTDTLEKLVAFIEERRRSDSLSADVAEFEKDVRALCSAVGARGDHGGAGSLRRARTCGPCRWGSASFRPA